jgi:starvation-inducible DNA-binding protein
MLENKTQTEQQEAESLPSLIDSLRTTLATLAVFKHKTHAFHWNIVGSNFVQYHELFGDIYTYTDDTIDTLAEFIRQLDQFAPTTLASLVELSLVDEEPRVPKAEKMLSTTLTDLETIIEQVEELADSANAEDEYSIANYAADLQGAYSKFRWKIKSTLA